MASSSRASRHTIDHILQQGTPEQIIARISPAFPSEHPLPPDIPETRSWSAKAVRDRQEFLSSQLGISLEYLHGSRTYENPEELKGNIEHYIGMTLVPTGVMGPLRINGIHAKGDFYIPFATNEGALLASYHRGAQVASQSGGVTSICLTELVQRSPVFKFKNFGECGMFLIWAMQQREHFQEVVARHSSHAHLDEIRPNVEGNEVTLIFEFTTGDASGQNMVTICTNAIGEYIAEQSPIKPQVWYVEGNLSGDKKATAISLTSVRGKKVTAELLVPKEILQTMLHVNANSIMDYWKLTIINGIQSGSIGVNGQFANGITGLFLACGQDVACAAEASIGTTRMDATEQGDLYVSVTLPNLIVGTVGGGTHLPTQHECLAMLGCLGEGSARKFAEICAAVVLCGELSIVSAMASGNFARAHALFGRKRTKPA